MPKLPTFCSRTLPVCAWAILLASLSLATLAFAAPQPSGNQQAGQQNSKSQNKNSQGQNSPDQNPQNQSSQEKDQQGPVETLKVPVNVVSIFFNVKDKHGLLIPNQTKDDFEVLEDGKPQTIKYFTAESNLPLTLGMMIDASGSQRNVLDMEKEVGGAFLKQILTDKDEAYVISFDVDTNLMQDFTRDVHRLQSALNKVKLNTGFVTGPLPGAGGGPVPSMAGAGTVLFDAVYLSAHDMLSKEVGRKAMILLTDGQDEGSKLKIKDAIEAAQKADAIVYVLLCADRGFYMSQGAFYGGSGDMDKLTKETGGRVINVGNKFDKLKEAFDQIATELRSQYNIGYTPSNIKLDGSYRKLEIKNKQNYKIQARAGYYAGHSEE